MPITRTVTLEIQGRTALISLSNPPANQMNEQLLQDLHQTLNEIEEMEEIGAILIGSDNPKVFAVGRNDGNDAEREFSERQLYNVLKRIILQPIPTVCIISGSAIGSGFEIALACDLRISCDSSRFGFYSDSLPTSIGKDCLMDLIGPSKMKEMIWLGQVIDAQAARDIGIVNRIFPAPHLLNEGLEIANAISFRKKHM